MIKHALAIWPSPFAASLLSYSVSSALLVLSRPRALPAPRHERRRMLGWFALAGLCNGASVLALYAAFSAGPLTLVAPLAATAPLFAMLASLWFLRDERRGRAVIAAVMLTVLGAALLVC